MYSMYEVGDKIFLEEYHDRLLNRSNKGKYVEIIAIAKFDDFLPYGIRSQNGETHWINKIAIKCKLPMLGIKV